MPANSMETAKLSRMALVAMVVGSMVGAGIFSLPGVFSRYTGPQGGLVAWAIAGTGMLTLAMVFQFLTRRRPDLDSGIFAYAKAGFGPYIGFLAALGYWTAACLGNVRYFRSEEHTSELQSLMRISYAVFCLKKK